MILILALVWNLRTWSAVQREKAQAAAPRARKYRYAGRQLSIDGTSRVTGDCHARFCERLGGEIPRGDSAVPGNRHPYRDPGDFFTASDV